MTALAWSWAVQPTMVMCLLYLAGVQYYRGGAWRVLWPVGAAALLFDVLLNYTLFALITWDWPRRGEYTFSTRLERLIHAAGWRGSLARAIARYLLDWADPRGFHIHPTKGQP